MCGRRVNDVMDSIVGMQEYVCFDSLEAKLMVKAELNHNPYLLETKVKFNGQAPKINSLIEKYQHTKLQTWICRVPKVFYNEMNGYDFDFDFSGTRTDYEGIIQAFIEEGLLVESEDASGQKLWQKQVDGQIQLGPMANALTQQADVRLFFRNELKDARTKSEDVARFLAWLENTPNRRFDNERFRQVHSDVFDEAYTCLLIQGSNVDTSGVASAEITIENATELADLPTDLTNTPILFYLDEQTKPRFREFFENIIARPDVIEAQFFFLIHPELNSNQIERTIQDLGVKQPQIVERLDDEQIQTFFEIYPITEYIATSIQLLSAEAEAIATVLNRENEASRLQNYEVRREIARLEKILQNLKKANEQLNQKDNFEISDHFAEAKFTLSEKIQGWRKKKASINNDIDAQRAASDYERDLEQYFSEFIAEMMQVFTRENEKIRDYFRTCYHLAEYDDHFEVNQQNQFDFSDYYLDDLSAAFLVFRKEQFVEQPEDFFGLKKLFGEKQTEPRPLVQEISYSLSSWRYKAAEVIIPEATQIITALAENLKAYYETVAQAYQEHLTQLLVEHTQEKDATAAKLSDEEQKLQLDNDWLAQFQEKLNLIARG